MQISLRDLYVLLECGKHALQFANLKMDFSRDVIQEVVDDTINNLSDIKLEVKEN